MRVINRYNILANYYTLEPHHACEISHHWHEIGGSASLTCSSVRPYCAQAFLREAVSPGVFQAEVPPPIVPQDLSISPRLVIRYLMFMFVMCDVRSHLSHEVSINASCCCCSELLLLLRAVAAALKAYKRYRNLLHEASINASCCCHRNAHYWIPLS